MEGTILEHVPLAPLTTFGVGGSARYFASVHTTGELVSSLRFAKEKNLPITILGGGSNVLVDDGGIEGLVITLRNKGIHFRKDGGKIYVTAAAGERWDDLVGRTIEEGLYGIENLSFIPGSVGAAPVQNIGSYGQELSERIVEVRAYDIAKEKTVLFSREECAFKYRDSVFKSPQGNKFIVTGATLLLSEKGVISDSYEDVRAYFATHRVVNPTLRDVRVALADIRKRKFTTLSGEGTAGSFFKNPTVSKMEYETLQTRYGGIPGFVMQNGSVKIPLAWILDHVLHLNGYTDRQVTISKTQPLVLRNTGSATADDILHVAQFVKEKVFHETGICIEKEVRILT